MTRLMAHTLQLLSQVSNTLGGPPQGRLRISTLCRMDELLQILLQRGIDIDRLLASPTRSPDPAGMRLCWSLELFDATADGLPGHPRGARHDRNSPKPNRLGLRSYH